MPKPGMPPAPLHPQTDTDVPDIMPEAGPAAAGVVGAAAAHLSHDGSIPQHPDQHRLPRIRLRFQGDRDRRGKKVRMQNESQGAETGKEPIVPPTIGE
ncbi:hypothetical protein [Nocardia pseudobrasiliensis]|nr:hypothetical protein [Nocardia pseudobrasiliensis]